MIPAVVATPADVPEIGLETDAQLITSQEPLAATVVVDRVRVSVPLAPRSAVTEP
jgi:hypothetical protein